LSPGKPPIARRQYQRQGALRLMKNLPVTAILTLQLENKEIGATAPE
jgi:hypothetical protein